MLVLNFHWLTQTSTFTEEDSRMSAEADMRGFIVAYPQLGSQGFSWNAGSCCGNPHDDVRFVRDLVTELESQYCIDPKRIFAAGLSNGAMMAYRLGCEASDLFAAIAPVAGAVAVGSCNPSRPARSSPSTEPGMPWCRSTADRSRSPRNTLFVRCPTPWAYGTS